jgi:hypothetical protein
MNIKAYLDYFSDISHLARDQQYLLLEQAHNEACSRLKPLSFNSIALLIRTIFIVIITGGCYLFFGYSIVLLMMSVLLALLIARVVITEFNSAMLTKSLEKISLKKSL